MLFEITIENWKIKKMNAILFIIVFVFWSHFFKKKFSAGQCKYIINYYNNYSRLNVKTIRDQRHF